MNYYLVNLYSWENPRLAVSEENFVVGDRLVVEGEFGNDIGNVIKLLPAEKVDEGLLRLRVIKKASSRDEEIFQTNEEKKEEIMEMCKKEVRRLNLEMKMVDAKINLDGSAVTVVFTADGRVDFRELVKNLARIFRRSVKMHQIGSREEARRMGGCGVCGRDLCCVRFSGDLPSVSTEMARIQRISHRGSERISGLCGRLMCCLVFEAQQYQELLKGMPEIGSFIQTKKGRAEVIEVNALKQEVTVRLENGDRLNIKKEDLGKV